VGFGNKTTSAEVEDNREWYGVFNISLRSSRTDLPVHVPGAEGSLVICVYLILAQKIEEAQQYISRKIKASKELHGSKFGYGFVLGNLNDPGEAG
jgi:hypothetical protein